MITSHRSSFWQASPDYHGVIATAGALRLAVSPNGTRYLLQECKAQDGEPLVIVLRWRKVLSLLLPDLPPDLLAGLPEGLPERAADFPRPWAALVEVHKDRVRIANHCGDGYGGVIARGKGGRLVWLASGPRYAVQVRADDGRWLVASSSKFAYRVAGLLFAPSLPEGHPMASVCGDLALMSAAVRLPASAVDYTARKVESLADALQSIRPPEPRRAGGAPAPSGRALRRNNASAGATPAAPQGGLLAGVSGAPRG